jgi:hypothetical protein
MDPRKVAYGKETVDEVEPAIKSVQRKIYKGRRKEIML